MSAYKLKKWELAEISFTYMTEAATETEDCLFF